MMRVQLLTVALLLVGGVSTCGGDDEDKPPVGSSSPNKPPAGWDGASDFSSGPLKIVAWP